MADIFRGPLITPIPKRAVLPAESFRNAVLLAAIAVAPFHSVDLGQPFRARAIPQAEIPPNTLVRGIPQTIPFRNEHVLPPLSARISPQADSLSGVTTRGIVPPPPVRPFDWTNPQLQRQPRFDNPPNLLTTTLRGVVNQPFFAVDVATPTRARIAPLVEAIPNTLVLGIPQIIGFNQYDWPNPVRAKASPQGDSLSGVTTRGITPPPPVAPFDWQNPAARKPQRFDDPPNLLTNTLKAAAVQPFFSIDVGQPFKARIAPLVEPVPNTLILGIPQTMGFNAYDWPNPTRAKPATVREILPNLAINLPPPFALFDWPTPLRAKITPQAESGPVLLLGTLFQPAVILPFRLTDWPQPYRARPADTMRWSNAINLSLQTIAIPNVVGETQAQGATDLQAVGFTVSVSTSYSATIPVGQIISQQPTGTALFGSNVQIVVSLGIQPVSAEQPAGRARRAIYFVTIDGQRFQCRSLSEALALLERAKQAARELAQERAARAIEKQRTTGKPVVARIEPPKIEVSSRELRAPAAQAKREIASIYKSEFDAAEIAMLMELVKRANDDDEALILLL